MSEETTQFDDPALKAALKRAAGDSRASDALRRRVERLAAETRDEIVSAPSVVARIDRRPNRPWRRYVVAAVVLMTAGLVSLVVHRNKLAEEHRQKVLARNYEALDPMAEGHGEWTLPDDAEMVDWSPSPESLAIELSQKLGRPIPVVNLEKQGWQLSDTSVHKIDGRMAARLRFTRGDKERLTVFSLPAGAVVDAEEGSDYAYLIDNHPIAGFVRKGSVNCVVLDEGVDLEEAVRLREVIRKG
jgi:hypothetical protein